jgi:hypothetical protein
MSQENLEEFVRDCYAGFNGAEPGVPTKLATVDFYDPDAVYVNDARDPDTGVHRASRR